MKSTAKAIAQLRELAERLEKRLSDSDLKKVRQSSDSEGWPVLTISNGNEAAGESVIAIRMKAADAVSKDVFGNDLVAFTPHTLEIGYDAAELNVGALVRTLQETAQMGVKTLVKETETAAAVDAAALDAGDVVASLEADTKWPTKGI